ncbi:MAG: class I SAM-dependent methyltransferase [Anaeromicrobium sp.]|jgi:SAM-dependent methyltransferase|uniref:class I SAM-dependent methyltransferase n=1 Tax=Anaeromicrobium sp. TaxID=1929132 RepID=UPI0025E87FDB|nr:class I SAM-dependent methyltransferase [Anaeromicrobium sp.]MCT4595957.1 class I SAM-dependent methyltransferase [Anaeromicrobium sp.]
MSNIKCKICESDTNLILDTQFNHEYFKCKACDFIFQSHVHHISYEEERTVYDKHNNSLEDEKYVDRFENFIDKAAGEFVQRGDSLDYGSGPEPVLSVLLERRGFNSYIYDRHYAKDVDYKSRKYDLITSTEVFEHFHDPILDIKNIVDLLKEKGVLAIMTMFPPKDVEIFKDWWYRRDNTHISFYSQKTFEKIAEIFNLEILYSDHKSIISFRKK